jgi:hypothetical protein
MYLESVCRIRNTSRLQLRSLSRRRMCLCPLFLMGQDNRPLRPQYRANVCIGPWPKTWSGPPQAHRSLCIHTLRRGCRQWLRRRRQPATEGTGVASAPLDTGPYPSDGNASLLGSRSTQPAGQPHPTTTSLAASIRGTA